MTRSDASSEAELGMLAELARDAARGPVVMLNLLKFVPDGGIERYLEYSEAVGPLLAKVGGKLLYAARGAELLIGSEPWDLVALVEYPTRQAFLDMVTSPEYAAIRHLREEALERSVLHAMDPLPPDAMKGR